MQFKKVLGLALALAGFGSVAEAQTVVTMSSVSANEIAVNMDADQTLQGWSWGVCNDATVTPTAVNDGATTATVNGGGAPDFNTINIFPEGWTVGVVISFVGTQSLAAGTGYEMNVASYDNSGLAETDSAAVTMCHEALGSPAVSNVVVAAGASLGFEGDGNGTAAASSTVTGAPAVQDWGYDASEEAVNGQGLQSTTVSFFVNDLTPDTLEDTQGFSMGWSHSSANGTAASIDVANIVAVNDLAGLNGGSGPDFFGTSAFANGWTVGVVYAFVGGQFLQFPAGSPAVIQVAYDYDLTMDDTITITVDNGLGSPPVANVVVVAGASADAAGGSTDGSIELTLLVEVPFVRGDCNDDGIVNIADAVWTLNELFLGGDAAPCPAACDSNGDGMVDATDASYTLNYRFLDGPEPPAPFPACGGDGGAGCVTANCP